MKCYVHIGTEKTGTTAIQQFLRLNSKALAEYGYLFPESTGRTSSRKLAVAAYNPNRRDDFTRKHEIIDDHSLQFFQKSVLDALDQELMQKTKRADYRFVVFSSEHIHARLRTQEEVNRLKTILFGLGLDDISIVVYLREPVAAVTSLYSTAIKSGATYLQPPPPENEYYRNLCDHRATLLRYGLEFGRDSIVPRLYGKSEFVNGSIFDDFLKTIGIHATASAFNLPCRPNSSVDAKGIRLLRKFNERVPMVAGRVYEKILRHVLVAFVERYFNGGVPYRMSPERRRAYELAFAESNEWVRKNYFPKRSELFL